MSKAPLLRDITLGTMAGLLVGTENEVTVNISGHTVTAKQLRALANQMDSMQAAVNAFYGITEREYAITYSTATQVEESEVLKAANSTEVVAAFYELTKGMRGVAIKAVYDRQLNEYVDFPNKTPRDYAL